MVARGGVDVMTFFRIFFTFSTKFLVAKKKEKEKNGPQKSSMLRKEAYWGRAGAADRIPLLSSNINVPTILNIVVELGYPFALGGSHPTLRLAGQ